MNYQVGSNIVPMLKDSESLCMCPLKDIIDIIGRKWPLLVVNAIGNHKRLRFSEIMEQLGISPRTLSETLKGIEMIGLINRQSFSEIPPRVEYSLTEDGVRFRKAIVPLLQWALVRTGESPKHCEKCYSKLLTVKTIPLS